MIIGKIYQQNEDKRSMFRSFSLQPRFATVKHENKVEKQKLIIRTQSQTKHHHILSNTLHNSAQLSRLNTNKNSEFTDIKTKQNILHHSIEKENKILINQKSKPKPNSIISKPFSLFSNQEKKLSLQEKSPHDKWKGHVIDLLNYCYNNDLIDRNSEQINLKVFSEKDEELQTMKTENDDVLEVSPFGNIEWMEFDKEQLISEMEKKEEKLLLKENRLKLCSKTSEFFVLSEAKVNKEVQTMSIESEYFDYLVYKRKKEQYEKQLADLFNDISIINQDRKEIHQRKESIEQIYKEKPENEREERVYKLKEDMNSLERKITFDLNEMLEKEEIELNEVEEIEEITLSGIEKIKSVIHNYLQIFKEAFKDSGSEKYQRITERLENIISNIFFDINKEISSHTKQSKYYKKKSTSFKEDFDEFITSNQEYKHLLKNCFEHLKKTPELCCELFGFDEIQSEIINGLSLKNERNEFVRPKCVECFNSKWKLHTLIDHNISMKSVLKVSEELLK